MVKTDVSAATMVPSSPKGAMPSREAAFSVALGVGVAKIDVAPEPDSLPPPPLPPVLPLAVRVGAAVDT